MRARTIFAIIRPMTKTNTAPMMFGMNARPCSSMEVTGVSTCVSWTMPSTMIRPSSQMIIETIVPSAPPSLAPSAPCLWSAGIRCASFATAPLSTAARIAVMMRTTMAARTLRPNPAQS